MKTLLTQRCHSCTHVTQTHQALKSAYVAVSAHALDSEPVCLLVRSVNQSCAVIVSTHGGLCYWRYIAEKQLIAAIRSAVTFGSRMCSISS